jgi:tyrosine-protein phosphatase SIW14
MFRKLRVAAGTVVVVLLIVGPVVFAFHEHAQMPNFRVVREGVLYRCGQPTPAGLKRAFHDYGIKTVICLRDGRSSMDREAEALCGSEEVTFVRIPPTSWGDMGGSVPAEAGVKKFKEILNDPRNYPVLVHCFAGIHRTGVFTAIYRMEFEHWSNEMAIAEMRACGYSTLDDELDISTFLEQYRPDWKPPEPKAPPKSPDEMPRPQTRRGSHGSAVGTVLKKGTQLVSKQKRAASPFSLKKRVPHVQPGTPRPGRKTKSRPARPGATIPGGVAAWQRPGGA